MMETYILDSSGSPVAEPDLQKWVLWFEKADKKVAREEIGGSIVSTVFLGVNHNYKALGKPLLWETMIFGGSLDQAQDRCDGNREQAEAMHARMVDRVKLNPK